jgi:hypothetical protein
MTIFSSVNLIFPDELNSSLAKGPFVSFAMTERLFLLTLYNIVGKKSFTDERDTLSAKMNGGHIISLCVVDHGCLFVIFILGVANKYI